MSMFANRRLRMPQSFGQRVASWFGSTAEGTAGAESKSMKLIVGLGNPGQQYAGTRHNIGFEVIERLAAELAWCAPGDFDRVARNKFGALLLEGVLDLQRGDRKLLLLKPTTYMNRSGESVQQASRFYK